jgi:hypothetical protein
MSEDEGVGRGRECDCAVRIFFDQDADRHSRWRGGAEVGVDGVSNMSNTRGELRIEILSRHRCVQAW